MNLNMLTLFCNECGVILPPTSKYPTLFKVVGNSTPFGNSGMKSLAIPFPNGLKPFYSLQ